MIKRNLYFLIIVFLFLFSGCKKNNSDTSNIIEKVGENDCTYIYPKYDEDSDQPSRYCFTTCTRCPEGEVSPSNIEEYCKITHENTKYMEKIFSTITHYLGSTDSIKIKELNVDYDDKTLISDIESSSFLNTSASDIKSIKDDTELKEKCLNTEDTTSDNTIKELKNFGIILKDVISPSKKYLENYGIIACNSAGTDVVANLENGIPTYFWDRVPPPKTEGSNFNEVENIVKSENSRLPSKDDCHPELMAVFALFGAKFFTSNFWLSTKSRPNKYFTCTPKGTLSESDEKVKLKTIVLLRPFSKCNSPNNKVKSTLADLYKVLKMKYIDNTED